MKRNNPYQDFTRYHLVIPLSRFSKVLLLMPDCPRMITNSPSFIVKLILEIELENKKKRDAYRK